MQTDGASLIVATGNAHKVTEITGMCTGLPVRLYSLRDFWAPLPHIDETGVTFLDNARIKARWVTDRRDDWALADDSGLEVDALDGRPGVYSSRYAGESATDADNVARLLEELRDVPRSQRTARFRCVLVLRSPDGREWDAGGECCGHIGFEPSGSGGFGYDPVFYPESADRTFAQLDAATKDAISHRGAAMRSMREILHEIFL